MSKVIPILLSSHYEQKSQSTALLVKITRRDGEIFGCTSHDADLSYLGMTWEAGLPSLEPAQTVHTSAFASDNTDLSGLLAADGLTQVDIESGIWDGAAVEVWRVNWRMLLGLAGANVPLLGTGEIGDYYLDLWTGIYYGPKTEAGWGVGEAIVHEILGVGELGQFSHDALSYKVEFKGMADRLQKTITRSYLPNCDATFGDARCGLDASLFTFPGAVTAVVDRANFTDSALAQAADYFTLGKVTWLTGDNAGHEMEVKDHLAGGVIELALAMPYPIQVGDTFDILVGDDHMLTTCRDKFNNIVNFRGFWYIPGVDQMLRPGGV